MRAKVGHRFRLLLFIDAFVEGTSFAVSRRTRPNPLSYNVDQTATTNHLVPHTTFRPQAQKLRMC